MVIKLSDRITLTDEVSSSSYGVPVAIIAGKAHGPRDLVGGGGHAMELVQAEAITARLHGAITTEELAWCAQFWR